VASDFGQTEDGSVSGRAAMLKLSNGNRETCSKNRSAFRITRVLFAVTGDALLFLQMRKTKIVGKRFRSEN